MMATKTRNKWLLAAIGCMATLGLPLTSRAAVIVYFQQDGADVTMTWVGTLSTITLTDTTKVTSDSRDQLNGANLYHRTNGALGDYGDLAGSSITTSLTSVLEVPSGEETTPSFGLTTSGLIWNDVHIAEGSVGAVTKLAFDPARDVMRFSNRTLAGIGAASFSNTPAWQANVTGDTIRYTTGPVPEPSSLALVGLGSFALMTRRYRRR